MMNKTSLIWSNMFMRSHVLYFLLFFCAQYGLSYTLEPKLFPVKGYVQQQVSFWEKIFTQLPSTSALIHDMHHPEILIDLIDHHRLADKKDQPLPSTTKQSQINDAYLERYRDGLKRFQKQGAKAKNYSPIENRIYEVYAKHQKIPALIRGHIRIRSQSGLSDQLILGGSRAHHYLNQMEKIFDEYHVPPVITRLTFVESMFNNEARSKVGASGVWQFMPRTASNFITVNKLIDERNSPLKATRAAAKLLAENYKLLGTWPLAITAYNHGPTGLLKASKKYKSKKISTIIRKYQSSTFGYASKNFYSEFIAAAKSYQKFLNRGLINAKNTQAKFYEIKIKKRQNLPETLKSLHISRSTFQLWNPEMTIKGQRFYQKNPLPKNYKIIVPASSLHSKVMHDKYGR